MVSFVFAGFNLLLNQKIEIEKYSIQFKQMKHFLKEMDQILKLTLNYNVIVCNSL